MPNYGEKPDSDLNTWTPTSNETSKTMLIRPVINLGITVRGDLGGGIICLDTMDISNSWWPHPVTISESPSYTHFHDLPSYNYRLRLVGAVDPSPTIVVEHNDPGHAAQVVKVTSKSKAKSKAIAKTGKGKARASGKAAPKSAKESVKDKTRAKTKNS